MAACIRLGLTAAVRLAQNHLNAWKDLEAEGVDLVAVCDIDEAKAKAAGGKVRRCRTGTPMPKLFAKERLGLVDIATQMRTHLPLATWPCATACPPSCKTLRPEYCRSPPHDRRRQRRGIFLAVHENFPLPAAAAQIAETSSRALGTPTWAASFRTGYDIYSGQPYLAKEARFVLIDLGSTSSHVARCSWARSSTSQRIAAPRNPNAAGEDNRPPCCSAQVGAVSVCRMHLRLPRRIP